MANPFVEAGLMDPEPPSSQPQAAPPTAPDTFSRPIADTYQQDAGQGAPDTPAPASVRQNPFITEGLMTSDEGTTAAPSAPAKGAPAPPPAQKPTAEKPSPQTSPEYKPLVPVTDDATTEEKMKAFAQNLIPSIWHQATGVADVVRHPIDTAKGVWSFGTGINALIDESQGKKLTPEQEEAKKPVQAYWEQKKDTYGTDLNHFFTAFANNPGEIAMDASVLLSGGAGAASKVPLIGKIPGVTRAIETAGAVGRAVDPLAPVVAGGKLALGAIAGAPAAARAAVISAKAPQFLDRGGQLTQAADAALQVASQGTVTAADIADHAAAARTFAERGGISPASAREVIMRDAHPDVAPAVPITAGKMDEAYRGDTMRVMRNNEALLADRVAEIAGGNKPEHVNLGRALDAAATESSNHVAGLYDQVHAMGHTLDPAVLGTHFPVRTIPPAIEQRLDAANIVNAGGNSYARLSRQAYPQTRTAIDTIAQQMRAGTTTAGVPLRVTERVRAQLNDLWQGAEKTDRAGLRAVIDGFDDMVENAANTPGMLRTANGAVAPGADAASLVRQMQAARGASRDFHNTYTATGRNATTQTQQIAGHTRQLFNSQTPTGTRLKAVSADDAAYHGTGSLLNAQLLKPNSGVALYDHLVNPADGALRSPDVAATNARIQALNTNLRQSLAALDGKDLAPHMRANGLASRVFTPEEVSQLRTIKASRDMQNALASKPDRGMKRPSITDSLAGPALGRRVLAGFAGHAAGSLPGAAAFMAAEGVGEHLFASRRYNKMRRIMRETEAPSQPGMIKRALKAAVMAPVASHRALAQSDMIATAMGARQKDQGGKPGGKPAAIKGDALTQGIRMQETGNRANAYTMGSDVPGQSASGAYQIIDDTWKRLTQKHGIGTQYARAKYAPPEIQDAIFEREKADFLRTHNNDARAFARYWYSGNPEGRMTDYALAVNGGQTADQYADKVLGHARRAAGTRAAASGGRIERAAGGGVKGKSHEQLVRRLMAMADTARREVNKTTKPLLGMHDTMVAKALAVANEAI